jgi:xanthosine utilization system XapX-like protein
MAGWLLAIGAAVSVGGFVAINQARSPDMAHIAFLGLCIGGGFLLIGAGVGVWELIDG